MQNLPVHQQQTMSSREIAELVDSRHDSVKRTIERCAEKGAIVQPPMVDEPGTDAMGRPRVTHVYQLDKRSSLIVVAQLCPEFTARIVDRWQELESQAARPPIAIPQSLPEALRLAADLAEQKAIAEQERDEAIRTKAMIGSKREATAMATAAAAKREAERLAAELDRSMQYASVKRMEQVYTGRKFNWRELKKASIALGLKAIDVFDQNYITVKAYHAAAWKAVYSLDVMKDSAHA
ncbi:MAG: Rha family transcriptional regulator [Betaproteobacteria bacterium]